MDGCVVLECDFVEIIVYVWMYVDGVDCFEVVGVDVDVVDVVYDGCIDDYVGCCGWGFVV